MAENIIDNRAEEVPFSLIIADLLLANLQQKPKKRATFKNMFGKVALNLPDIEAAVTLIFAGGRLRIEPGILGQPDLIINSSSENIISLNAIHIKFGLPYYFDEAGLNVFKQLLNGDLKIQGLFTHPLLLTRFTKIMSVM
jgi:hypothetical protein